MRNIFLAFGVFLIAACSAAAPAPSLTLRHDQNGEVSAGDMDVLVAAIRNGCQITVAWGARRRSDRGRTIEHAVVPVWISVRDGGEVEAQLEGFAANLGTLGMAEDDPDFAASFVPTDRLVHWRANLKTDGSFDAIWYYTHSGELVRRIPQRHPMSWFANCNAPMAEPLYQ